MVKISVGGKQYQKVFIMQTDLAVKVTSLEICRDLLKKQIDEDTAEGWPLIPELLNKLTINGKNLGYVYPISSRDGVYDPLGITGDRFSTAEKVNEYLKIVAADEQKATAGKKYKSNLEKTTFPLAIAAGVMVVILTLVAAWGYYASII